ncbi:MAG: ABC transporter permease [Clostridia bacterium]|nr:ABC transporter permease [Clostridia bacterium]
MKNIQSGTIKKRALWFAILTAAYFCVAALFFWLVRDDWYRAVLNVESVVRGFTTAEIKEDTAVTQTLRVPADYLMDMTLEFNRWNEDDSAQITVTMTSDGQTLWSRQYAYSALEADSLLHCSFPDALYAKNKTFTLTVTAQGGLAAWCGDTRSTGRFVVQADSTGALAVNGETMNGQLVVSFSGYNQFNVLPYFWPVVCGLYIVLAVLSIHEVRKKNSLLHTAVTTLTRYQYLLRQLVTRDFRIKYQASVLGILWSFLNPMLMTLVYHLVFSTIFRSTIDNFIIYLMSGIILFNYFSEGTSLSLSSVVSNASLITKVHIPIFIFPISKILSSAINLCVSFLPLFVLMAITGVPFRKSLLLIPMLLIFLIAFTAGMGLILSAMYTFFRDIQFLWSVMVTMWNFATPIFYPDSILPQSYLFLFKLNPLYHICAFSRMIIMNGASPVPSTYLSCFVSSFTVLAVGLFVYHKTQDKFVLYL